MREHARWQHKSQNKHELLPMMSPGHLRSEGNTMGRSLRCAVMMFLALAPSRATGQDIPGLEACTAEKKMERRTGCLQSDDEFLQQALSKLARETQAKIVASGRALAAAEAEIAALKSAMEKLNSELAQMKAKFEPAIKK